MTSSSNPSAELPRAMSVDIEASDSKPSANNGADAAAQCKFRQCKVQMLLI